MTASLAALLAHLIDYAGLYPPAALPLSRVTENYRRFLESPERWILNRLVLPGERLAEVSIAQDWRITLLVQDEPGPLAPQVETLETKVPRRLSLPTYCEISLQPDSWPRGAFAKIRTGGLTQDTIPATAKIAGFLWQAAAQRLPFKATAGLHHPIRSLHDLTSVAGGPRATMHGFLNVFIAAAFAWQGMVRERICEVLEEPNAGSFEFADADLRWRGNRLTTDEIRSARRDFAHSFGSCSFEEPLSDLRNLGLLP